MIELNPEFTRALELMEKSRRHLFITGEAGTGKSTLLDYFRTHTEKQVAVLAPTGVAALNVRGETIHSFFRFKPDITPDKVSRLHSRTRRIYEKLDVIVIDEISMVRADLLDCVDRFLRLNRDEPDVPFGGVQMIFIGDLYQLPPVVTGAEREIFRNHYPSPYFFDSRVFQELEFEFLELTRVYRQQEPEFVYLLNQIRNNTVSPEALAHLNSRVGVQLDSHPDEPVIHLTARNEQAAKINNQRLRGLPGQLLHFRARVDGNFNPSFYPTDELLALKRGAQVMMLVNDSAGRWVNGTLGWVLDFVDDPDTDQELIEVQFTDRRRARVAPFRWEIFRFRFNETRQQIESELTGTFTQYPLRLAWAVTIHKAQGKTFERVVIDLGAGAFAPGQVYVALSRCTSFAGISLTRPVREEDIFTDWRIVRFLSRLRSRTAAAEPALEEKLEIIRSAIRTGQPLRIVYLKPGGERSCRLVIPRELGNFQFRGSSYPGLRAFCTLRQEERTFRLDRILSLKPEPKY
ncbi:MAG: AAA family ATPase [candidate division WOR-3 bacterium]